MGETRGTEPSRRGRVVRVRTCTHFLKGIFVAILRRILRVLGWGATILLVGAFLVGYAAPYLPPAYFWWTNLFAVPLVPLAGLVGLLGLGLVGRGVSQRAWGWVAVGGVLLGLVGVRFGPSVWSGVASVNSEETLRLMSFNVPMTFGRRDASARALTRFVERASPDVVAFQESWMSTKDNPWPGREAHPWPPRLFLEDIGYSPPRAHPRDTMICQPVLGRVPLDSIGLRSLPPHTNRCGHYTRTQFRWGKRAVVLYNIHLHTIGSVRPWKEAGRWGSLEQWGAFVQDYRRGMLYRAQQARRIRRHIEQETRPVLVVGDFNSTPHQWAYRHLAQELQSVHARGTWGWGGTFPARRPVVQIDHILVGPAWEVVGARVPALSHSPPISDHRPIVARLRWATDYSE